MRIDLSHDRIDHQPKSYSDPVVARKGVFAELDESDLSKAEIKRIEENKNRDENAEMSRNKIWTPRSILNRITKLYAGFVRPKGR